MVRDENGRGARPVAADEGKAPPQLPHVVPRVEQEEEDHGTTSKHSKPRDGWFSDTYYQLVTATPKPVKNVGRKKEKT